MPTATATESEPTHDFTLYDGTTTYGFILCDAQGNPNPFAIDRSPTNRTSIKMSQGRTKYDDLQGPHLSLVQSDWSGGRGLEDFSDDSSRYFDSFRMNTWMQGRAILGPQETYTTGYRDQSMNMPGKVQFVSLIDANQYLAYKFDAGSSWNAAKCYILLKQVGTPNGAFTLKLCADNGSGDPGTVLQTVTFAVDAVDSVGASQWHAFNWSGTQALTDTDFHVKVYAASGSDDATDCWQVATDPDDTNDLTQKSGDDSSWTAIARDLYFRVVDGDATRRTHFYEYKGALYKVISPPASVAAKIYINGDRGAADANTGALTTLIDASKTDAAAWVTNEWAGCTAVLVAGTGSYDEWPYRNIVSNTATVLTVSPAWSTTHDTTTEYVILGSSQWTEKTGHGLSVSVTDVAVSKDVVYFAQGDSVAMRRGREYNNSGTWATQWDDEGGSTYARLLQVIEDPVDGPQVWKGNDDSSSEVAVARATGKAWGTDLTFGTDIVVGNRYERLTGLESYGDPVNLWVLKEGSIWEVANDIPNEKPLREMKNVASFNNGRAHLVQGVYLYFSLLQSLERYYRNNLDDVGPWSGAGLPAGRQGHIFAMQGYPAFFWAAIRGQQTTDYSSILLSSGHGDWHEFYRAPEANQRIMALHLQVIPGFRTDRLWVGQGTDTLWLPVPSRTFDPYRDSQYRYTHEGHIISAWHYANMQDVVKFWNTVTAFAENLSGTDQRIRIEYQSDGDIESDTWTDMDGYFDAVPSDAVSFTSDNSLSKRRIRYRLRFVTTDNSKTPKLKAVVVEALGKVPPKWQYSFTFRAKDENLDREGDDDSYTSVETLITKLDAWAAAATPLTMRCLYSPFDNKTVFIDASPMRPYLVTPDEQTEAHVSQLTVYEN